jgi:hypothetical protein
VFEGGLLQAAPRGVGRYSNIARKKTKDAIGTFAVGRVHIVPARI